jgi:hypothetical protein
MTPEQPFVVSQVIGKRHSPQPADADDHDPHGAILVVCPEPTEERQ